MPSLSWSAFGEHDRLEQDGVALVRQGVARRRVLQADSRGNVAGKHLVNVLAPDRVHAQDSSDALLAPVGCVHHARAGLQLARVDPEKGELAHTLGVHLDLEGERRERLAVLVLAHDESTRLGVRALHGGNVRR